MRTGVRAGEYLRAQIEAGKSIRGLAKEIAASAGEPVENWRGNLYRYLRGREPKDDQASAMEAYFQTGPGYFRRYEPTRARAEAADRQAVLSAALRKLERTVEELAETVALLDRRQQEHGQRLDTLERQRKPRAGPGASTGQRRRR